MLHLLGETTMANGVNLYNEYLFGGCYKNTIVKSFNNAPGLPGGGGVDADATGRIGFKNIDTGERVAGSNKGRIQGICCGITAGWMVALLGGNSGASDHGEFNGFFMGPLRFQGAYVKDFKGNSSSIKSLLDGFGLRNSNKANSSQTMSPYNIGSFLPPEQGTWAGYISAYAHAIGIGYRNYRYFIMEPNGGLFEYSNKRKFISDLSAFLNARHKRKGVGTHATMTAYFYTA
jgi:hypothetical protein